MAQNISCLWEKLSTFNSYDSYDLELAAKMIQSIKFENTTQLIV